MQLKRGDTGPNVVTLQTCLIELGYPLPRYGADGDLGDESLDAAAQVLTDHGRRVDPSHDVLDDDELSFIFALRDLLAAQPPPESELPSLVVDRRAFTGLDKDRGPREWTKITGWCLHQTACHLGASSDIARCDNVGAHFVVYQDGRVFWLHDLNRIIIHGNGWNNQCIGIEIDGLFAGIEGDPQTVWNDPDTSWVDQAMPLTPAQAQSVKQLMRWGTAEVAKHGGLIHKCVAHRQSSGSRRNDPGSKVWQEIALPMSAELGFDDGGPGFTLDDGYPIPVEWDPKRTGYHY